MVLLSIPILIAPGPFRLSVVLDLPYAQRDMLIYSFGIGCFYLNRYSLVPRLFFHRRYVAFGLLALLQLMFVAGLPLYLIQHHPGHHDHKPMPALPGGSAQAMPAPGPDADTGADPKPGPPRDAINWFELRHGGLFFLTTLGFTLMMSLHGRWREAQKEKLVAELSLLRAQVNPHFLFNALNGIYALSLENAKETPNALLMLSSMMRYALTDAAEALVPLNKEVEYLQNFVALQRLRLGDTVEIALDIAGDWQGRLILPMVLITFVENAFKHGVDPEVDSRIWIQLHLHEDGETLHFACRNLRIPIPEVQEGYGLGLENARKRLALTYPGRHKLDLSVSETDYLVTLQLKLEA
jgi:hypothetical protein